MAQAINIKNYALAALLIHGSNQEVTEEKIKQVLMAVGVECVGKIASKFALSTQKYSDILSAPSGTVAAPVVTQTPVASQEKIEEPKKESSDEDIDLDF